jgi:hypothetical protein
MMGWRDIWVIHVLMSDILDSTHVPDSHEASMYTSVMTPALDFHESFMVD